jgi:hypothetical protein
VINDFSYLYRNGNSNKWSKIGVLKIPIFTHRTEKGLRIKKEKTPINTHVSASSFAILRPPASAVARRKIVVTRQATARGKQEAT